MPQVLNKKELGSYVAAARVCICEIGMRLRKPAAAAAFACILFSVLN